MKAVDKYLTAATILVVMNPLENHSLMQIIVVVSQENLTSKANTLIDTAAILNFVSKHFLNVDSFYKLQICSKACCQSSQRVAHLDGHNLLSHIFTIDGHEFAGLQCRVLLHFNNVDIILGLPDLRELYVTIQFSSINEFTLTNATATCHSEPRRIIYLLVESGSMDKILVKQSINKKNPLDIFLISL